MLAKTSRGGAAARNRQVCADGASIAPDCSRARSGARRILVRAGDRDRIGWRSDLRGPALDPVTLAHAVEAGRRVGVQQPAVTLDERNDMVAQVPPSCRPLEVRATAVVIGAVEGASRVVPPQPGKGLLMAGVHPERHLRLAAIPAEMAFPDQEADQEPGGE